MGIMHEYVECIPKWYKWIMLNKIKCLSDNVQECVLNVLSFVISFVVTNEGWNYFLVNRMLNVPLYHLKLVGLLNSINKVLKCCDDIMWYSSKTDSVKWSAWLHTYIIGIDRGCFVRLLLEKKLCYPVTLSIVTNNYINYLSQKTKMKY